MVTKKKKRSEEIAIEIQKNDSLYREQLDRTKAVLAKYNKELEHIKQGIGQMKNEFGTVKEDRQIKAREGIIAMGKLRLKLKLTETDHLSTQLAKDFKGYISPGYIRVCCREENPKWLRSTLGRPGHPAYNVNGNYSLKTERENSCPPETAVEKEGREVHERQVIRDETMSEFVYEWTNKNNAEQGEIIQRTPKGTHWGKILAEESEAYILKVAKGLITSDIGASLADLRIVRYVADKASDILYEEQELRKRKSELESV